MEEKVKKTEEKEITKANGMPVLLGALAGLFACTAVFVISYIAVTGNKLAMEAGVCLCAASSILALILLTILGGLHIINPNEAIVMTLFGEYYGTIKKQGFYWTNPFVSLVAPGNKTKKKISLKTITLNNKQQKVNDALGRV